MHDILVYIYKTQKSNYSVVRKTDRREPVHDGVTGAEPLLWGPGAKPLGWGVGVGVGVRGVF
jgi:hypothetical protein